MDTMTVRTDLALEERESALSQNKIQEINGVKMEEKYHSYCDTTVTKVRIISKNGAAIMHKPMGNYITFESDRLTESDKDFHKEISKLLSEELLPLLQENLSSDNEKILVVGLGNMEVTADSLGPRVVNQLFITRHMILEYGKNAYNRPNPPSISSISPGVMAKTGMETAEIVKGIINETHPDLLIVVDSLAARSIRRLNHTIQISDTGIQPGSGVGNHRSGLTKETMGIPVIAIGIPMVVDAATIITDFMKNISKSDQLDCLEIMENQLRSLKDMYVTGKDIDAVVRQLSFTISEGLNRLFTS